MYTRFSLPVIIHNEPHGQLWVDSTIKSSKMSIEKNLVNT